MESMGGENGCEERGLLLLLFYEIIQHTGELHREDVFRGGTLSHIL